MPDCGLWPRATAVWTTLPNEHIRLDEYWQAVLVLESALRRLSQQVT